MKNTYVIGITGGIAGGKTTVSDLIAKKGECVIDADVARGHSARHNGRKTALRGVSRGF